MFEFELQGFDECTKKQTCTGHKDIKKKKKVLINHCDYKFSKTALNFRQ